MLKETFLVPRDMLTRNCMVGTELAVYLTLLDTFSVYNHTVVVRDDDIVFLLSGNIEPTTAQRKMVSLAMRGLINKKVLVAEQIERGRYTLQCYESFSSELKKTQYGYIMIDYEKIRTLLKACPDPREWQKLIIYYYDLLSHMGEDGTCRYSLRHFSENTGISELTLSKYNKKLVDLGLIKIIHHKESTSTYCRT